MSRKITVDYDRLSNLVAVCMEAGLVGVARCISEIALEDPKTAQFRAEDAAKLTITITNHIASIAMQGCSALTRIDNPVQPGYPCGTRAHSCSLEPLTCGAAGTSCPAGACCYRGESYSAFPVLDGGVR